MKNLRLFKGINDEAKDVPSISPDSFRFHGTMKALFYRVLKLINPPPKKWMNDLEGNNAVLRDIYEEYLVNEKQQWRKDVLTRVIPFSILMGEHDENYKEVFQWYLYRVCQEYEKGNLKFHEFDMNPNNWYQDGIGRPNALDDYLRPIAEEAAEKIRFMKEKDLS